MPSSAAAARGALDDSAEEAALHHARERALARAGAAGRARGALLATIGVGAGFLGPRAGSRRSGARAVVAPLALLAAWLLLDARDLAPLALERALARHALGLRDD